MPQLMRTSNPALGNNTFQQQGPRSQIQVLPRTQFGGGYPGEVTEQMTLNGTVNKTGILLVLAIATAGWTWHLFMQHRDISDVTPWMMGGMIGGLVFAMITLFKKEWAPVTAPAYAALEGLALGGISSIFELRYPGIAVESVSLTFGTLFVLLLAYRSGLIKVTQKFRLGVVAATGGIMVFYLVEMALSFFHINFMSATGVNGSGMIGIGFSLLVVGVAALNLVLDFDFIEKGVAYGAPKYMEWYGAFGLMVTLVWLYLEMLRLLSKINSRR